MSLLVGDDISSEESSSSSSEEAYTNFKHSAVNRKRVRVNWYDTSSSSEDDIESTKLPEVKKSSSINNQNGVKEKHFSKPKRRKQTEHSRNTGDPASGDDEIEQDELTVDSESKHENSTNLKSLDEYVSLFQEGETGQKIHPSASRFAFKAMAKEASRTIQSVSQSLKEDGRLAESRRVQKRSNQHVEEIVARVRRRLNIALISSEYAKLRDYIDDDLERTNSFRLGEIEENRAISKQLLHQRKLLKKEYNAAKAARDRLQRDLNEERERNVFDRYSNFNHGSEVDRSEPNVAAPSTIDADTKSTLFSCSEDEMTSLLDNAVSPYD